MFVLWLLVILSLAGIFGTIGFSQVPPPLAVLARALFALFVILLIAYVIWGGATGFRVPDFMTF